MVSFDFLARLQKGENVAVDSKMLLPNGHMLIMEIIEEIKKTFKKKHK